jgi:hypothetical protein
MLWQWATMGYRVAYYRAIKGDFGYSEFDAFNAIIRLGRIIGRRRLGLGGYEHGRALL